jgi:hypothetical protein
MQMRLRRRRLQLRMMALSRSFITRIAVEDVVSAANIVDEDEAVISEVEAGAIVNEATEIDAEVAEVADEVVREDSVAAIEVDVAAKVQVRNLLKMAMLLEGTSAAPSPLITGYGPAFSLLSNVRSYCMAPVHA